MSKQIKQMEMDALKKTFAGVRDMVLLSSNGLDCHADSLFRTNLSKKNIRLHMVKNSLARRVFAEMGIKVDAAWSGPTLVAWGADSLADLSKAIDGLIGPKKNDKVKPKLAVAEGQAVTFDQAKTMPTRAEAIATILGMTSARTYPHRLRPSSCATR